MAEGHRLRGLQMGIAGHDGCRMFIGPFNQHRLQRLQVRIELIQSVAHPKLEIGGHLVVPGPGRVQPAGGVADQFGQPGLHVHMDILKRPFEIEGAGLDLGQDLIQPGQDRFAVFGGDDLFGDQHLAMGLGGGNILGIEPLIKADRRVDLFHDLGRAGGEAPAPHGAGVLIFCRTAALMRRL